MLKLHRALVMGVAICSLLIWSVSGNLGAAQNQAPVAAPADLLSDQELDALLLAKKWNELAAALSRAKSPDSVVRMLDWLHSRLDAGGGSLLGFIYAKDLWDIGEAQKLADPTKDLRITAGLITLYTYELIAIDGAKCADHSAPSHRVDQLLMNNAPALAYLKAQPPELKNKVVDLAIAMEKKTASLRKLDDLLCRGGLEEMQAGIAAGKTREVPTPPGQVGKSVEVEPPADFAPRLLTPQSYLPDQERARANMKAILLKLIQ